MKLHVSTDNTEYPIIINSSDELEVLGDLQADRDAEEAEINEQDHENND